MMLATSVICLRTSMFVWTTKTNLNAMRRNKCFNCSINLHCIFPIVLAIVLSTVLVQAWTSSFQLATLNHHLAHPGSAASTSNGEEFDFETDYYYRIAWKDGITLDPKQKDLMMNYFNNQDNDKYNDNDNEDNDNVVPITSNNNEKYVCYVPNHGSKKLSSDSHNADKNQTNENSNENKSPFRVLEPLFNRGYCSYRFEPFWVYELCHGKFLRQYHEESDKLQATQEYFLGLFRIPIDLKMQEQQYEKQMENIRRTGSQRPTITVSGQQKPYLLVNMTAGTHCELTNTSRMTKVYYVCSEGSKHELYSIKEVSTCEYEAIVRSPTLCLHPDFKQDTTQEHEIACYPLDGAPIKPKALDKQDEEDNKSKSQRKVAFFDGRTLIIDAEDIDALMFN